MTIALVRHGKTAWSRSGRHTGRTNLALTEAGRDQARRLRPKLADDACRFCEEAGFGDHAVLCDEPREWGYGDYEG